MSKSIKTGDIVKIISGGHKNKTGKVVKVDRAKSLAFVEGINERVRHIRPSQMNPKGGKKNIHVGLNFSKLVVTEENKEIPKAKIVKKTDKKKEATK